MRTFAALTIAAALAAALPVAAQTTPASPVAKLHTQTHHHEMPKPKNLQVLPKDISGHDLIATMHGYEQALGVECSFCHAEDPATHRLDFASDANPHKSTARTMMRMTQEINTKYLATIHDPDASPDMKTVTCGTCHRGHSMPMPFVAPKHEEHGEHAKS